jgi:hypothetical protein
MRIGLALQSRRASADRVADPHAAQTIAISAIDRFQFRGFASLRRKFATLSPDILLTTPSGRSAAAWQANVRLDRVQ